jgi:hypothetical protein
MSRGVFEDVTQGFCEFDEEFIHFMILGYEGGNIKTYSMPRRMIVLKIFIFCSSEVGDSNKAEES